MITSFPDDVTLFLVECRRSSVKEYYPQYRKVRAALRHEYYDIIKRHEMARYRRDTSSEWCCIIHQPSIQTLAMQ